MTGISSLNERRIYQNNKDPMLIAKQFPLNKICNGFLENREAKKYEY